jgi:hypothetical protein
MIAIEFELLELALELLEIDSQVQESADEHITGDATEEVEI